MEEQHGAVIWALLRGDMAVRDFEQWFYAHADALQAGLGADLHEQLLDLNYGDHRAVEAMLPRLEQQMRPGLACACVTFADKDSFSVGLDARDGQFHATVRTIKAPGTAQWWLSLGRCTQCGQHWQVARDDLVFDLYLVDRVSTEFAEAMVAADRWPTDFGSYGAVLTLCQSRAGRTPFRNAGTSEVQEAVRALKAETPVPDEAEIAALLGLSVAEVAAIVAVISMPLQAPAKRPWWQRLRGS